MAKRFGTSLFIFRRDLRVQDNTALMKALQESDAVVPVFIADPRQVKQHSYRSLNAVQFMAESLQDLQQQLQSLGGKLYLFQGEAEQVVTKLLQAGKIEAVYVNRDYTPFSQQRDKDIAQTCKQKNIAFISCGDLLLHEPEEIVKADASPYTVFSHFYKYALELPVLKPASNKLHNYFTRTVPAAKKEVADVLPIPSNPGLAVRGGRETGLSLLRKVRNFANYEATRDFPALNGTTHLSAHLKFGTISAREFFHRVKEDHGLLHGLIRELFWRDFFTHIAFHYPHVFGNVFRRRYDEIEWDYNEEKVARWSEGNTGFPIVDAGMRQLNTTGWMHNRARLIVASFLVKDLHVNWRLGEQYFAQHLVDYDPSVNNGNWQWVASTGYDAQPFFRIFNPWLQQKRYDPDAVYIKQWVPELADTDPVIIHQPHGRRPPNYPAPMVIHEQERAVTLKMYREEPSFSMTAEHEP
jgi:deoxyribodipyrimidine photo-lyase